MDDKLQNKLAEAMNILYAYQSKKYSFDQHFDVKAMPVKDGGELGDYHNQMPSRGDPAVWRFMFTAEGTEQGTA